MKLLVTLTLALLLTFGLVQIKPVESYTPSTTTWCENTLPFGKICKTNKSTAQGNAIRHRIMFFLFVAVPAGMFLTYKLWYTFSDEYAQKRSFDQFHKRSFDTPPAEPQPQSSGFRGPVMPMNILAERCPERLTASQRAVLKALKGVH